MSELPTGWANFRIDEIADYNPKHPKETSDATPVSFVPMTVIAENSKSIGQHGNRPLGQVRKGYTHFADGDVLIAKITPCFENGKGAIANNLVNGIGCGTTELHVLRPSGVVLKEYLYYFLHREQFRKQAKTKMTGTAGQLRVPSDYLKSIELPLPPLNEQKRIVAKLDELLPKVEACKERLQKIPAILKRFRQSVLAAAVSGKLTEEWRIHKGDNTGLSSDDELPESWLRRTIADVIEGLKYGTSVKCTSEKQGSAVLRIPNIVSGAMELSNLKYGKLEQSECEALALKRGDILLIRSNGSVKLVGRTALVRKEHEGLAYAGYLIRLRPKTEMIDPEYFNLLFSSTAMRNQIEIPARSTSGVNNINSEEVRALKLPLPPLDEQVEIVRLVSVLLDRITRLNHRLETSNRLSQRTIDSILSKAFSDTLVPQDPNDEPAAVLLERIKQAKAGEVGGKTRRGRKGKANSRAVTA